MIALAGARGILVDYRRFELFPVSIGTPALAGGPRDGPMHRPISETFSNVGQAPTSRRRLQTSGHSGVYRRRDAAFSMDFERQAGLA